MVRSSLPEQDTICLHPEIEDDMLKWLQTRSHPAFLLIGTPGLGKTTMVYRVCKQAKYWIQEFNASHTRTGSSFRQTILPLLTEVGVSKWIHPSTPNGRAVLLDEMDGLSQGEKGGLQELLDYLKSKRDFKQDCPLILICNVMEGRIMQQLLKYCCVRHVKMPKREMLCSFFKKNIPDDLYKLGDLRKVSQSLLCEEAKIGYGASQKEQDDNSIHVAIRAAWLTLYEEWNDNDELDLETKDANLSGLLFHQNLPARIPFEAYYRILSVMRWSDRADFWAFFHQCWNLLPLSYNLKLKYPNKYIYYFPLPDPISVPKPQELQYTQVLTKQSALFNSWKEMNRLSNEHSIPFRCISQWATYQTGKTKDILGLSILPANEVVQPLVALNDPSVGQKKAKAPSDRKKVVRRKKASAEPS
jgi:DNA polymerase III delta prime subunit